MANNKKYWPGFDRAFDTQMRHTALMNGGLALQDMLGKRFVFGENKPFDFAPPVCISKDYGQQLISFVRVYHRAIETIIQASHTDQKIQHVLQAPCGLEEDLNADIHPNNGKVHLCRIDFLLSQDGNFKVLETNANCPGAMIFAGFAAQKWREYLQVCGIYVPESLEYEGDTWMADWFLSVAEAETGIRPAFVPILRPTNGNTLELQEFTQLFHQRGVAAAQYDPRELRFNREGAPVIDDMPVRHAYLKVGIQDFCRLRPQLGTLVAAVRQQQVFVQNGQRGRWIGDNKLCLALLSDPAFHYLFDAENYEIIKNHIPWSRNIALCSVSQIQQIQENPLSYVLKHPFDTRGRGVVIGKEGHDTTQWQHAVQRAIHEGWLVQEYCDTTEIEADSEGKIMRRHDLAIGAINGSVAAAFVRSSSELRVNMALSGSLHPVFLDQ